VELVAPRRADLFEKADVTISAEPAFDPPAGRFRDHILPTWLELDLACTPHATDPRSDELTHPHAVVVSGRGEKVLDAHGLKQPGRFVIWGPEIPLTMGGSAKAKSWLKTLGLQVAEILGAFTLHGHGPSTWELYLDHCDEDGNPALRKTTLRVWPGDQYELSLKIPPIATFAYGVSGEHVKGGDYAAKAEASTKVIGVDVSEAEGTDDETGEKGLTPGKVYQAVFREQEFADLTRNGKRDQSTQNVLTLVNSLLDTSKSAVDFFAGLKGLTPKFGWWFTVDLALLAITAKGTRSFQVREQRGTALNQVDHVWGISLEGTLVAFKIGIKAGLEVGGDSTKLMIRGVVYAEIGIELKVDKSWTSDTDPAKRKILSSDATAGLEIGMDIVIGHPNVCSAKAWTKAPYTVACDLVPPDMGATPPRPDWGADWKHGCKDGIYLELKGKLFFKFGTHKRLRLKKPVPLE